MKAVPKYQFLVKYNQDRPDWVPKNVHTLKWVQQQDLIGNHYMRHQLSASWAVSLKPITTFQLTPKFERLSDMEDC